MSTKKIQEEPNAFDRMGAKYFRLNTEWRNAKNRPCKDKTSEEIAADVEAFLAKQNKINSQ